MTALGDTMDQMRSIFLVGFMGAGKSSVGAAVARKLGLRFVDLDDEIQARFDATIPEIFERHGEPAFRSAEREELARFADLDDVVVATGGGAFCSEGNREIIRRRGALSVFLDLPWPALRRRLARDNRDRPKYADADQAEQLFDERLPDYRRASFIVTLDGAESSEEVAVRVVEELEEASCVT